MIGTSIEAGITEFTTPDADELLEVIQDTADNVLKEPIVGCAFMSRLMPLDGDRLNLNDPSLKVVPFKMANKLLTLDQARPYIRRRIDRLGLTQILIVWTKTYALTVGMNGSGFDCTVRNPPT